jgi:hypothetical protein
MVPALVRPYGPAVERPGSADFLAEIADREARTAALLRAWAEWAETA